jgi:phospholipid/cholesterol/gamma-HCH transport system permease protein
MENIIHKTKNALYDFVTSIGDFFYNTIIVETGKIGIFFIDSISWWFKRPYRWSEVIQHMEFVGNKSMIIIMLTGGFTGLVFTFQAWVGLSIVNAENLIGPTVGLGITRELGPVLTGLIIAARAGGAMAARLGTMRVTEQIDALEVMGVDAKNYLVAPRILASIISTPLLTAVFDFVALCGGYFLNTYILHLDPAVFLEKTRFFVDPSDINEGLIKAAVFGLFFATICTYRGYYTKGGAKGVGDATNQGVVASMVSIIIIDYFLTKIIGMFKGHGL